MALDIFIESKQHKTYCLYHGLHCLYDQCEFLDMNKQLLAMCNKGITHFFHALTFAVSRGRCLNMRTIGGVFKHLPRDPASVNAMKLTCVIVILAYFTLLQ